MIFFINIIFINKKIGNYGFYFRKTANQTQNRRCIQKT